MKNKMTAMFGILSTLILLLVGAVYAHGDTVEAKGFDGIMAGVEGEKEVRELMIEGLDPKFEKQDGVMMSGCTSQFERGKDNDEYMDKVNMMMGNFFKGIMGNIHQTFSSK